MNLGAIPRPKDSRDFKLGAISAPATDKPVEFKPDLVKYPKFDQQQQPACGAHAGAMLVEVLRSNELGTMLQQSPRFIWTLLKQANGVYNDTYQISDGTDMRSIMKVLQGAGVCSFALGGNDTSLSLTDYANMPITAEMNDDAATKVIQSYAFEDLPTVDQLTDAIWKYKAIILLIRCDNGFFRTTTPTFTQPLYGHFVVAAGYDANGIYIIDSTEADFSKSVKYIGNQYISFIKEVGTTMELTEEQIKIVKQMTTVANKYPSILSQIMTAVSNLINLWKK